MTRTNPSSGLSLIPIRRTARAVRDVLARIARSRGSAAELVDKHGHYNPQDRRTSGDLMAHSDGDFGDSIRL